MQIFFFKADKMNVLGFTDPPSVQMYFHLHVLLEFLFLPYSLKKSKSTITLAF